MACARCRRSIHRASAVGRRPGPARRRRGRRRASGRRGAARSRAGRRVPQPSARSRRSPVAFAAAIIALVVVALARRREPVAIDEPRSSPASALPPQARRAGPRSRGHGRTRRRRPPTSPRDARAAQPTTYAGVGRPTLLADVMQARAAWTDDKKREFDARRRRAAARRSSRRRAASRAARRCARADPLPRRARVVRDEVALAMRSTLFSDARATTTAMADPKPVAAAGDAWPPSPTSPPTPTASSSARASRSRPPATRSSSSSIDNPLGDVRVEGYDGTAIRIETAQARARRRHARSPARLARARTPTAPCASRRPPTAAARSSRSRAARCGSISSSARRATRASTPSRRPASSRSRTWTPAASSTPRRARSRSSNVSGRGAHAQRVRRDRRSTQVFGSVDAQTMSSDVDLDTINGEKLVASVDHGQIAGRRVRARDVELTTTDGKIVARGRGRAARPHRRVAACTATSMSSCTATARSIVRARGAKVDLGAQQVQTQPDGWVESSLGAGRRRRGARRDALALRQRQFAIVVVPIERSR